MTVKIEFLLFLFLFFVTSVSEKIAHVRHRKLQSQWKFSTRILRLCCKLNVILALYFT